MRIISFDTAKTVLVDDNDLGCGAEAKRATVATSALRLCVFAREMPCRSPEHLGMIRSELDGFENVAIHNRANASEVR